MAIPLREYRQQVNISKQTTGVAINPNALTAPARALERAIEQTGRTVEDYMKTKRDAREASERADFKFKYQDFQNKLVQAKSDYIQKGQGNFVNSIDEVFAPMINDFQNSIAEFGYTQDMTQWANEQFAVSSQQILGAEIIAIEDQEIKSYQENVKNGLIDTYIQFGNGEQFQEDKKQLYSFMTKEQADSFSEGIRVSYINEYGKSILMMDDEETQNAAMAALRFDLQDIESPAAKAQAESGLAQLESTVFKQRYEAVSKANASLTDSMLKGDFDLYEYNKVRSNLPVYQQELLDQQITLQVEREALLNPQGQASEVIKTIKAYRNGELTAEEAFAKFIIKGQVEGKKTGRTDISTQTQALFFVLMNETMETQALNKSPIEQYDIYNGELVGLFPVQKKVGEMEITFGDYGGDFIEELFTITGEHLSDPVGSMITALKAFKEFRVKNPNPTKEDYIEFKRNTFGLSAAMKIRQITGASLAGSPLRESDRKYLDQAKDI